MANNSRVDTITHDETRANIPSAELEPVLADDDRAPVRVAWERRNRDLDPQLVWRGKDPDQAEMTVDAPPIYLQEQVHPKALIDDLRNGRDRTTDLFGHFGLTEEDREAEVEFYRHSRKWSNRMILGDALAVMSSLSEREGLRGQVQAIYIDPPYGIRFDSNFQWSTTSRDVKDGKLEHLTREPEQVKAFRDTWRDGIHSYLAYLRDRLTVARELLTESGSCFVQIGDENLHRVRALMDEVFGEANFVAQISAIKTTSSTSQYLGGVMTTFYFAKNREALKYRSLFTFKELGQSGTTQYKLAAERETGAFRRLSKEELSGAPISDGRSVFAPDNLTSQKPPGEFEFPIEGKVFKKGRGFWKTHEAGFKRLRASSATSNR